MCRPHCLISVSAACSWLKVPTRHEHWGSSGAGVWLSRSQRSLSSLVTLWPDQRCPLASTDHHREMYWCSQRDVQWDVSVQSSVLTQSQLFESSLHRVDETGIKIKNNLNLWRQLLPYVAIKYPVPRAERQSARISKITNDGLTRSDTGCFIAVTIWQQWMSKEKSTTKQGTWLAERQNEAPPHGTSCLLDCMSVHWN